MYQKTTIKYKLTIEVESDFNCDVIKAQASLVSKKTLNPKQVYYFTDGYRGTSLPLELPSNKEVRTNLSKLIPISVDILETKYFVATHSCNGVRFMREDSEDVMCLVKDHTERNDYYSNFVFDENDHPISKLIDDEWYLKVNKTWMLVEEMK